MSQSVLLPAFAILLGAVAALFFGKPKAVQGWGSPAAAPSEAKTQTVSQDG